MKDTLRKFRTRYVLVKFYPEETNHINITEGITASLKELMGLFAMFRIDIKLIDINKKGFVLIRFRYYDINPQLLYFAIRYTKKFGYELVPIRSFGTLRSAKSVLNFL